MPASDWVQLLIRSVRKRYSLLRWGFSLSWRRIIYNVIFIQGVPPPQALQQLRPPALAHLAHKEGQEAWESIWKDAQATILKARHKTPAEFAHIGGMSSSQAQESRLSHPNAATNTEQGTQRQESSISTLERPAQISSEGQQKNPPEQAASNLDNEVSNKICIQRAIGASRIYRMVASLFPSVSHHSF